MPVEPVEPVEPAPRLRLTARGHVVMLALTVVAVTLAGLAGTWLHGA